MKGACNVEASLQTCRRKKTPKIEIKIALKKYFVKNS
jgi:hypothetical protein